MRPNLTITNVMLMQDIHIKIVSNQQKNGQFVLTDPKKTTENGPIKSLVRLLGDQITVRKRIMLDFRFRVIKDKSWLKKSDEIIFHTILHFYQVVKSLYGFNTLTISFTMIPTNRFYKDWYKAFDDNSGLDIRRVSSKMMTAFRDNFPADSMTGLVGIWTVALGPCQSVPTLETDQTIKRQVSFHPQAYLDDVTWKQSDIGENGPFVLP